MFTKVLVVDDIDLNNVAAIHTLQELGIPETDYAKYCDEALLKIKKAHADQQPYQLLISDLSFKADHRSSGITSGEALIATVKQQFPLIKIIVFSIEDRSYRIRLLFEKLHIDGYVMKDRNSILELKKAIQKVYTNETKNISQELSQMLQQRTINEIDQYDINLLECLCQGIPQDNMEAHLKRMGITPNSKSTIEKRLSKLKDYFKANNTLQLIAIAKDLGLV